MTTHAQRLELRKLMGLLVRNEPAVHYRQARPMSTRTIADVEQLRHELAHGGISMDCSESVTLLCRLAGLQDPNGLHYNGTGFTGTLLDHLPHYHEPRAAAIGALVVFGPGTGDHVAMVHTPDARTGNPRLFSHGQERGPLLVHLHDEAAAHRPPVRFLSIAGL